MSFRASARNLIFFILMGIVLPASAAVHKPIFSIYWCGATSGCKGFSRDFTDVNPMANFVFIAFATVYDNGEPLFKLYPVIPKDQFKIDIIQLHNHAVPKKVILSVAEGWKGVMQYPTVFAKGILNLINEYDFDGVDLDIEGADLANAKQAQKLITVIHELRRQFNTDSNKHLFITITPECMTVMNTVHNIKHGRNAMVPVINKAIADIDFIQIQEYNDYPYRDKPGTKNYLQHIYISWLHPFLVHDSVNNIRLYHGIPPSKLVMGVPASPAAAQQQYYISPEVLRDSMAQLQRSYHDFGGVMIWSSYLDMRNNYVISNAVVAVYANTPQWKLFWPKAARSFSLRPQ